ncbi:AarF/ABC1/UbiB kinase family protein [Arthrobacter sp. PAMC25564]|uniref:ABC1 kinase family protein n=1 Tax=Arthrobacter sp. PAMC25564 TaxID=2565366 RepID=UPI0010A271BB|nr:AarF/ABC1/UbiB kinase family protein [Arthrobacter sp. PAMC25564]QCB96814.1 AarF/ABC1/UbiB kinase family protein [Arthrobacter sp. PAMC25564]
MSARRDRFRYIVETLTRHGLGFVLGHLGLDRRVWAEGRPSPHGRPPRGVTLPVRVRLALEDLGAVYIKFGQIVSTRTDVLPPEYASELAKLQDASPPVPVAGIRAVISEELGAAADRLLASLDDAPLATGSIGQVHCGRVDPGDGTARGTMADVVVKVRRPGVVAQVNEDLEIMAELAKRAEQASATIAGYHVAALVDEFSQTLRAELDYLQEARNAELFAANFAGDPRVHIPRVFWDTTTSRVLTLERLRGIKVNDAEALREAGIDPGELAVRACRVLLKMVFEDGFFHADPHPGNFFVEEDGRLGIIDFGMVGHISDALKGQLVRVLLAVVAKDAGRLTTAVAQMCGSTAAGDFGALRAALGRLLDRYAGRPLAEVPLVPVAAELAGLLRAHHLRLPREMALMVKMLVMADGLGKQLDPGFELTSQLAPFTRKIVLGSLSPEALAERLKKLGWEALRLGTDAPDMVRRMVEVLERGGIDVHFRAEELDRLADKAEKTGNRIVAGLITAALINAIGEMVAIQPDRWQKWPKALFTAGIGGVGALGAYLALSSRHRR